MRALIPLEYFTPTAAGELKCYVVGVNDTLPAGTIMRGGLAYHPDGSLYVVLA